MTDKKQHGGKRPGAGRPIKPDKKSDPIRLTPQQLKWLEEKANDVKELKPE